MRYRYKKDIQWMVPSEKKGNLGSVKSEWNGEKHHEKAVIAAPKGTLAAAQYGLELASVVTITLRRDCPIAVHCGVWLEDTQSPWGLVEAVRSYPMHTEADVKRLVMR